MRLLTRPEAADFLQRAGLAPGREIDEVLSGFDFGRAVYERSFFHGEVLYQLIRLSSATRPVPQRGNWYGLAGMTAQNIAVIGGLAGRRTHKFEVSASFSALEGTARTLPIDWENEIGGPGGATQVYVPRSLAGRIRSLGPADDF